MIFVAGSVADYIIFRFINLWIYSFEGGMTISH